jgi:hypothetical protein
VAVGGITVTVRRYRLDKYGDRALVLSFQLGQCAFAPRVTSESDNRSTTVVADAELIAPPWSGVQAQDVVQLPDGSTWEVQGRPEEWQSPFTGAWRPGDVVPLKRTTG